MKNRNLDHEKVVLAPCPFCGKIPDLDDGDTLYPNAVGWKDSGEGCRHYCSFSEVPQNQWCYSFHCVSIAGGCGAEISGDSMEEAIEAWNRRA